MSRALTPSYNFGLTMTQVPAAGRGRRLLMQASIALLFFSTFPAAQENGTSSSKTGQSSAPATDSAPGQSYGPVDVLTDAHGVDLGPYVKSVIATVRKNWYRQVPEVAKEPREKRGIVSVRFHVMKDGSVTEMTYSGKSGDDELDSAAYNAIRDSSPLGALPDKFECQFLELDFHFYYNFRLDEVPKNQTPIMPCVKSTFHVIGTVEVTVSPTSAQVAAGATQQFSAAVTEDVAPGVSWTVSGAGCEGAACGVVSAAGAYTAPEKIPDPPVVQVTAASVGAPSVNASAMVTIVRAKP
jgi:TonB family protein